MKKRSTSSGVPVNLARRSSRWVAMPVGQVSRWHWRAMSQPMATSAAVPNANSSAPSSAATSTSRPVCRPPSERSDDAVAQVVAQQDLVDLGEAELPRRADVLDRRQRRRAGPAGVAATGGCTTAPALATPAAIVPTPAPGDELDADPGARVDGPQVGDELGEVLDRVDVVVRRRADVALAGLAATQRGDVARSPCGRAAGRPRRAWSPGRS